MKSFTVVMALLFFAVLYGCNHADAGKETATTPATKDELVARGAYLVQISGCNDCHSPKKPGPHGPELVAPLLLSGYNSHTPVPKVDTAITNMGSAAFAPDLTAAVGPWGISYAANLTPDATTGIGSWTEEQFKNALTKGKYKGMEGGRMLLPPMPWPNYAHMKEEDVAAIFAYLKSIPAVKNIVPFPVAPGKM